LSKDDSLSCVDSRVRLSIWCSKFRSYRNYRGVYTFTSFDISCLSMYETKFQTVDRKCSAFLILPGTPIFVQSFSIIGLAKKSKLIF